MKFQQIGSKLYSAASKVKFKANEASPELALAAGIGTIVVGLVLACRATIKAEKIAEEAKEKLELVEQVSEDETKKDIYTEEDHKTDKLIIYAQTGVKLLRVYAPAIVVETLGILAVCKGHNILRQRNGALAAAYAALDKGYREYRKRVADELGEEKEDLLHKGLKAMEIDIPAKDEEGREMTEKAEVNARMKRPVSEYARLFGEGVSREWDKSPHYNLKFVTDVQRWANDILKARGVGGVLFLNEVYDKLGFDRSAEGQVVGWVYDPGNIALHNFVDFGIYGNNKNERIDAFLYGEERSVWLDFNVDGVVQNYLPGNLKK